MKTYPQATRANARLLLTMRHPAVAYNEEACHKRKTLHKVHQLAVVALIDQIHVQTMRVDAGLCSNRRKTVQTFHHLALALNKDLCAQEHNVYRRTTVLTFHHMASQTNMKKHMKAL